MQSALVVLLVSGLVLVTADLAGSEPISPDRPDVSNSAETVRRGAAQLEMGAEYARESKAAKPDERRLAVQALARVGLTDRLEVRLEGEPLVRLRGEDAATDHGDLSLGLKFRFFDSTAQRLWPAVALIPTVKLAIADAPIGSERPDAALVGVASFDLPSQLSLDVNAGAAGSAASVRRSRPGAVLGLAVADVRRSGVGLRRDLLSLPGRARWT